MPEAANRTRPDVALVMALKSAGKTFQEIGEQVGLSHTAVYNLLNLVKEQPKIFLRRPIRARLLKKWERAGGPSSISFDTFLTQLLEKEAVEEARLELKAHARPTIAQPNAAEKLFARQRREITPSLRKAVRQIRSSKDIHQTVIDPSQYRHVCHLLQTLSVEQVAKRYGVGQTTIRRIRSLGRERARVAGELTTGGEHAS
jgi:transcriptional regulator with XRE-family HTH domain